MGIAGQGWDGRARFGNERPGFGVAVQVWEWEGPGLGIAGQV